MSFSFSTKYKGSQDFRKAEKVAIASKFGGINFLSLRFIVL